jgi:hypothetical protein
MLGGLGLYARSRTWSDGAGKMDMPRGGGTGDNLR